MREKKQSELTELTRRNTQRSHHPSGSPPYLGESNYVLGRIESLRERMGKAIYPASVPVQRLEVTGPVDRIPLEEAESLEYQPAELGKSLGPSFATFWFRLEVRVPEEWTGRRVDLAWLSNSEAMLWMDGRSIQGFNPGRDTARLIDEAVGGEEFTVYIEVACNFLLGADGIPGLPWPAPSPRSSHWLQTCEIRCFDSGAWDLYHDLRVLAELVSDRVPSQETRAIGPGKSPLDRPALETAWAGKLLYDLNAVCNVLDPGDCSTWIPARSMLSELLAVRNGRG